MTLWDNHKYPHFFFSTPHVEGIIMRIQSDGKRKEILA